MGENSSPQNREGLLNYPIKIFKRLTNQTTIKIFYKAHNHQKKKRKKTAKQYLREGTNFQYVKSQYKSTRKMLKPKINK